MAFEDYTTFEGSNEDEKWNGWKTGSGAERGGLKTDGQNTYWSGLVDMGTELQFEPALYKKLDIEPSDHVFAITLDCRIRNKPVENQQFMIAITAPGRDVHHRRNVVVDTYWNISGWQNITFPRHHFFTHTNEIWIGLWRRSGAIDTPQWEIEFDSISITEIT